jgi:hypothetical protein
MTPTPDPFDSIAAFCERLTRPAVGRLAASRAAPAAAAQWTDPTYLADLLDAEVAARQTRSGRSHTPRARLPFQVIARSRCKNARA